MKKIKLPGPHFRITSGIYLITCLATGDTYVGKSKNLNQRWCQHRHDLRLGVHKNPALQALYSQHGQKSFTMALVELVEKIDDLEAREVHYTELLKPTLNVVNTRLSKSGAEDIKKMIQDGHDEAIIAHKYNLSVKYLREIARGDRWADL